MNLNQSPLMSDYLKFDILQAIASRTAHAFKEISDAFDQLKSVDELLIACKMSENTGRTLTEIVNSLLTLKAIIR